MNRYNFSAAIAAIILAAGAASAQTVDQMVVKVGDLNLGTSQGEAIALKRINVAATQFCGGELSRDFGQRIEQQKCQSHMTGQAVSKLNVLVAAATLQPTGYIVATRAGR